MGLMDSLAISASGMTAERMRMDVIANNLANVNTTHTPQGGPYRRQQVVLAAGGGGGPFDSILANLTGQGSTEAAGVQVQSIQSDNTPFKRIYDPGNPDADKTGYVEMPNIDTVTEMVDMMSAQRAYEANVSAINATKAMAEKALAIGQS